jgi:hypothetical protein
MKPHILQNISELEVILIPSMLHISAASHSIEVSSRLSWNEVPITHKFHQILHIVLAYNYKIKIFLLVAVCNNLIPLVNWHFYGM